MRKTPPLPHAPKLAEALAVAVAVILFDIAISRILPPLHRNSPDAMWRLVWLRAAETAFLALYWFARIGGLHTLGLTGRTLTRGLRVAIAACLALGLLAALIESACRIFYGDSFLALLAASGRMPGMALFFAMCLFGPLFEEFLFRILVYGSLRKNAGVTLSILVVTGIFAAMHLPSSQVPLTQIVGGIFFAMSLELSGSAVSPIIIHIIGNTAIFLLPVLI